MNFKLIIFIFLCSSIFLLSRYYNDVTIQQYENGMVFEINPQNIIKHVDTLIEIGNSNEVFEESRITAREYIRDYLFEKGLPKDNVIYNRFEWADRKAEGKLITTTTWTGINIVIWSNTTVDDSQKIRVIGGHYDTLHWGVNKTSGAHDNLAGVGMIMEIVCEFFKYQQSRNDQTPYMFVLFDQEEPGALGSKSFVDYYKISKNPKKYAYFLAIDGIGYRNSLGPIIQTYPYEHKHQTLFSAGWLVNQMVQSGYQVAENGIQVGYAGLLGSLIYQAHRYHLHSIRFLSDDGPFQWSGVDSLLFTDLDVFYSKGNPDYHQLTDQSVNLDPDQLKLSSDILIHFILSTSSQESLSHQDDLPFSSKLPTNYWSPILRLFYNQIQNLIDLFFSGKKQYLVVGPICLHYFEILSISFLLLSLIYFFSFKNYRDINTSIQTVMEQAGKSNKLNNDLLAYQKKHNRDNNGGSNGSLNNEEVTSDTYLADESDNSTPSSNNTTMKRIPTFEGINGHRVLFLHLLVLSLTLLSDTVYTFELILISFIGLISIPYYKYNFNVFAGIFSTVLSITFIYQDIYQINDLGRKGNSSYQLSITVLLIVYAIHSILIAFYAHHYSKKREYLRSLKLKKKIE